MDIWKQKLAAFLHDPPSKALDLRLHEEHARTLYRQAGFVDEEEIRKLSDAYAKPSDWTASAADRFPFPAARALASAFDGKRARFHHPLSPNPDHRFEFHAEFKSSEVAMEIDQELQPVATDVEGWSETDQWRARFFCHWRLWEKFCSEKDYRFGFLPADTRIPDHTVWTHMQVVSALDGCAKRTGKEALLEPAFLKFQLGPVQEFIAEARSVRDLWSGSYLLSWLMAAGLKALAWEIGPDSVIFPNLKGQPLFDLHLRDDLWSQVKVNNKPAWEHFEHEKEKHQLLTPNLPNVFVAVIPRERAEELGKLVIKAVQDEWKRIAEEVWEFCENADMILDAEAGFTAKKRKERFDKQVGSFLSPAWQTFPWPENLEGALDLASSFDKEMPVQQAADRVRAIVEYATKGMPHADRDGRYYVGGDAGPKDQLNNIGLAWSVIFAFNNSLLDGVRQVRTFDAPGTGTWTIGTFNNKDSLGGKLEAVAGGKLWHEHAQQKGGAWASLFKKDDWLAAPTLIKRLWHLAYLGNKKWKLKTSSTDFPMPNTRGIADHSPDVSGDDEDVDKLPENMRGRKYFAVLALDGDQIGKWVSGELTPKFQHQFSDYTDGSDAQKQGALEYFNKHEGRTLMETRRALSPSYHLQFSQALSNFALLCARRIVEAHDGRLLYAGGDDVLAMLPADTALECAKDLRSAFQGKPVQSAGIQSPAPGYLSLRKDQGGQPLPFIVPGPSADCSAGIAIAHFKSPLQDVVRAARAAEKRAKSQLGRAAVAVSLFKRSGEITEWGAKWDSGGLELYEAIAGRLDSEALGNRFPHRICQLLEPYRTDASPLMARKKTLRETRDFDAHSVICQEFGFAISRQSRPGRQNENREHLMPSLEAYLAGLRKAREERQEQGKPVALSEAQEFVTSLIDLCSTVAFAHRTRDNSEAKHQPAERQPVST